MNGADSPAAMETDRRSYYMEKRRELMELKETDPEAFRKKIVQLRNNAQKRLDTLQETDPDTYQRIMSRRERRIGPKFERMRQEDPEAFAKMQEHHRSLREKRIEWYRQNDPAKFEEIQKRREARRQAWQASGRPEFGGRDERPWRQKDGNDRYGRPGMPPAQYRPGNWQGRMGPEGGSEEPNERRRERPDRPLRRENGR